jgi:tRNA pseudouridine55 synthase
MEVFDALDGALLVDKPAGPTSHDVVDAVRRRFFLKKVGHAGTLDPAATGLLILLLGTATRLSEKIMGSDKVYEGSITFGEVTSTYDAEGDLVRSLPVPPMGLEELNAAAAELQGDQLQVPPMVSAIKKDGVPLYKLARKGIEVERKPKLVRIYSFRFVDYSEPIGKFKVACTKGTYIRSLAFDLGEKLGCGAHLSSLRRISSGGFHVESAAAMDDLLNLPISQLEKRVIPITTLASLS